MKMPTSCQVAPYLLLFPSALAQAVGTHVLYKNGLVREGGECANGVLFYFRTPLKLLMKFSEIVHLTTPVRGSSNLFIFFLFPRWLWLTVWGAIGRGAVIALE